MLERIYMSLSIEALSSVAQKDGKKKIYPVHAEAISGLEVKPYSF